VVFAIIGLGVFGSQLTLSLAARNAKIIAVDADQEAIDRVKDKVTQAIVVDATDENLLSRVPFDNVDTAIVAISAFEVCAMAVAFLKQAGVPYIIARAETHIQSLILKKIGADEIVIVEVEQGVRLAKQLMNPDLLDTMPLSKNLSLAEVVAPAVFYNKKLNELDLPAQFKVSVVAIRRVTLRIGDLGEPEKIEDVVMPQSDEKIQEADILIVIGANANLEKFKEA
jgi:trk system potassium uptake protein TrkA